MSALGTEVAERDLVELIPSDLPARAEDVAEEVRRAEEQAESLIVDDAESAQAALEFSKEINRRLKAIEDERVSLTKPRKDAAEEIKRVYDDMKRPFAAADKVVRDRLASWQEAEQRKAEERKRIAEEERAAVEAEAKAKREAAEQAEREAADLLDDDASDEDIEAAAELSDEFRREAERAAVTEKAIQSLPPDRVPSAPALSGFSQRTKLEATVVDFAALPDTLPDGTPLKVVDHVAFRAWAVAQSKANGGALPELPGAEFKRVPAGSTVRT